MVDDDELKLEKEIFMRNPKYPYYWFSNKKKVFTRENKMVVIPDALISATLPNELYVPVIGHNDYWVSDLGNVFNTFLVVSKCKPFHGYLRASIDGKQMKVHILVAKAFLPSPTKEQTTVNHIKYDEKTNNKVSNLEWASVKEQNTKGKKKQLIRVHLKKQVDKLDKDGNIVETFDSATVAAKLSDINRSIMINNNKLIL